MARKPFRRVSKTVLPVEKGTIVPKSQWIDCQRGVFCPRLGANHAWTAEIP